MKNNIKIISFLAALMMLAGSAVAAIGAETSQADYIVADASYKSEVNSYKTIRQQFLDAKSNYLKLKNAANKKSYEDKSRVYLTKTVDVLIKKLEVIKAYVAKIKEIPEEEKTEIIAEIDGDISKLNQMKTGIETATPEQVISKAKEVRDYWKNHRIFVKKIIGRVWVARVNYVITRAENAAAKIDVKIQELKAAGRDTAKLEAWLVDFNQKIALAKEKKELAKAKFEAIKTLEQAEQFYKEGHQFILDANKYIREAKTNLADIVKEMKNMSSPAPTTALTPTPTPTSTPTPTPTPTPIE